jgi:putative membrane protein
MRHLLVATIVTAIFSGSCNNKSESKETADTTTIDNTRVDNGNPPADNATNTTVSDMDREFVLKVAMGNTAEVDAGNLASDKGSDDGVKGFGETMVKDHGDAQSKLKGIASSLGLNAPDSIDAEHKAMKTKLQGLSGKAFDREYIAGQVKDHQATISLFEKQVSGGTNSQIKDFASTTLPHLRMHLQNAESLQSRVGQ